MAAAGLQPGRESGNQHGECQKNVIGMTEFALMMMVKLEEINFNSFNQFKLRVGEYNRWVIPLVPFFIHLSWWPTEDEFCMMFS